MAADNRQTPESSEGTTWLSRRAFLSKLTLAAGGVVTGLLGLPVVGFLLSPLFRPDTEVWRAVGALNDFEIGETVAVTFLDTSPAPWAGVAARTAAWLRRINETQFIAFSVHCSHLGCPVRWQREARLFMCPCHGGVFHADGSIASGPLREPLATYPVRVQDGQVEIRTTAIPLG